jgi:uncharacterized membrane protein (DUF485 family)
MPEPSATDRSPAGSHRAALPLFLTYCLFYGVFIGLSAFCPRVMASKPFGGVNLAILYGFGLIIIALILACVYMWRCRNEIESRSDDDE